MSKSKLKTYKKILYAGDGGPIEYKTDTKAIFHFEVFLPKINVDINDFPQENDYFTSIDNTKKSWPNGYGKPFELVFGKKFQLPILESCVKTMLLNEVSHFDIDKSELYFYPIISKRLRDISHSEIDSLHSKNYNHNQCAAHGPIKTGYEILDKLLKKPCNLRIVINLLEVLQPDQYEIDLWQLSSNQKIISLEKFRKEGNNLFLQKKYNDAIKKYKEALEIIENLLLQEKPGDVEWIELDKKNIPFYLNLSQCFLNQNMYYKACQAANEVLQRDQLNEKALFRRAKSRIGLWDLDSAENDFNTLLKFYPNVTSLVKEHLLIISKKKMEKLKSDKVAYKAMINGLNKNL